jgi:hypothetical protein
MLLSASSSEMRRAFVLGHFRRSRCRFTGSKSNGGATCPEEVIH